MRNWSKYRAGNKARSEAAVRAARARWDRVLAQRAGEPVRQTRVVELTVVDSHRPRSLIRLAADEQDGRWGRWAVTEGGQRIGKRRFGRRAVADLIAGWLA
jgi:hypothetical protein